MPQITPDDIHSIHDFDTFYAEFGKPKIIYPQTAKFLYACYDTTTTFVLDTTFFISTSDFSLLAILNSQLFDWYARHKFQSHSNPWTGSRLHFKKVKMTNVPIATQTEAQKAALSQL